MRFKWKKIDIEKLRRGMLVVRTEEITEGHSNRHDRLSR